MSDKPAAEPTMDEILASIRRIISEDPAPPAASAEKTTAEETTEEDTMSDTYSSHDEPLVGEAAASASASAFDALATSAEGAGAAHPPISLPAEGRTLEDLTADLLRPLLKAWLDDNLPDIVRDSVDEEVRRISRGRTR